MGDEAEVARRLESVGHDATSIIERARSSDIAAVRDRNSSDAIAADAVGVPAYVLNGEVFWGQDRMEMLDTALATGRPPFTSHL